MIPVVPTTLREFTAAHAARAFVQCIRVGRGPFSQSTSRVVVTDRYGRYGAESIMRADRLEPERFGAARAADYTVPLPLSRFAPGLYLLTIRTLAGESIARGDVRFGVR